MQHRTHSPPNLRSHRWQLPRLGALGLAAFVAFLPLRSQGGDPDPVEAGQTFTQALRWTKSDAVSQKKRSQIIMTQTGIWKDQSCFFKIRQTEWEHGKKQVFRKYMIQIGHVESFSKTSLYDSKEMASFKTKFEYNTSVYRDSFLVKCKPGVECITIDTTEFTHEGGKVTKTRLPRERTGDSYYFPMSKRADLFGSRFRSWKSHVDATCKG